MKRTAVNIFSHNGGVALGLGDDLEFLLYTCYHEILKGELEKKIESGELPKAPIIKFSYTISHSKKKADLIAGLIHYKGWQERELSIPDPSGGFPPSTLSSAEHVHRASLYESLTVARVFGANEILLFFPYDPFNPALETMMVFRDQRVSMRCFHFPLQGAYVPSTYLYVLEIKKIGERKDAVEFIKHAPLAITVTNIEVQITDQRDLFAYQNAVVWDFAPVIIREAMGKIKELPREHDEYLLRIYSSPPEERPRGQKAWNHNILNSSLSNIISQRGGVIHSLGWERE